MESPVWESLMESPVFEKYTNIENVFQTTGTGM